MNRLVLIGNGFDLAHGLHTNYKDFIYWYWKQRVTGLHDVAYTLSDDPLYELEISNGQTWSVFYFQNSMYLKQAKGEELYKFLTNRRDAFRIGYTPFSGISIKPLKQNVGWILRMSTIASSQNSLLEVSLKRK